MDAASEVIGQRVRPDGKGTDGSNPAMAAGDYWKDERGVWYVIPPGCHYIGSLEKHTVVEHEDGTISVSPSIRHKDWESPEWHGHLVRGVWKAC